jgi:phosphopantetheinyl transferase
MSNVKFLELNTINSEQKHISISHSHEFSCICISNKPVGIDIELCKEKTQEDDPVDDGSDEETLQRKLLRLVRARITT